MNYLELLKLAAPEAIVVLTAVIVLTIGLTSGRSAVTAAVSTTKPDPGTGNPPPMESAVSSLVAAFGLIAAIAMILLPPHFSNVFGGMLVVSPLNSLFKIICLALVLAVVLLSGARESLRNQAEYFALLLLAAVGLMLLVGSEELLTIFIGLELLGLALYVLTGFDKADIRSAEAGLKYFLFGSTASAFTLFGISLIYGASGTTVLARIAPGLSSTTEPLLAAAVVMTLVGFAFKIAVAPFHLWAPDAYQGAPVPSGALIASASKVASFVVLGKIVLVGFGPMIGEASWRAAAAGWAPLLAALAALSILLGNFVALVQTNVRRLLAYSAVAHGGYTLLGLIAGGAEGFSATLFYTTVYAITLVGAFGVCAAVRNETGGDEIKNFAGLWSRSPFLGLCVSIFFLSLAGIPPLAGFFGKFYLFSVALHHGTKDGLLWLVAVALFGSFISLYYYLVVLKAVLVDQSPSSGRRFRLALALRAVLLVSAVAIVVLGITPASLLDQILGSMR